MCCQLTNNDGRGRRPPGAKCPQVRHHYLWQVGNLKVYDLSVYVKLNIVVFQVSVEVWHRQLLSWLQRHAGLLPHHGHETKPPV